MINNPENIVNEMVSGMLKAYPNSLRQVEDLPVIARKERKMESCSYQWWWKWT